jgi:protein-tyrosine phosphatase
MAEAYLRHRLARSALAHVVVASAGTLGINGVPASHQAVEAMAEIGIDLRAHRSRGLTAADLRASEIVLAMDHEHLEYLAAHHAGGRDRRFLIRAFEKGSEPRADAPDLVDPVGRSVALFRKQRDTIRVCLDHFVLALKHGDLAL